MTQLVLSNSPQGPFSLIDDILKYKSRLYVGNNGDTRNQIIKTLHSQPVGGYFGQRTTLKSVKVLFYWLDMKQSIIQFIQQCEICQKSKGEHVPYIP